MIIDDPNGSKSAATHMLLSSMIDIWIKDKPAEDKTDLMNQLIHNMNWWLDWKYNLTTSEEYDTDGRSYPTEKPECLKGGQLDIRIWNTMKMDGYMTLEDMAKHSDQELLRTPNFGQKSLKRLRELVAQNSVETRLP